MSEDKSVHHASWPQASEDRGVVKPALDVPASDINRLLASPQLAFASEPPGIPAPLFLDTPDADVRTDGSTLGICREGDRHTQTIPRVADDAAPPQFSVRT
jgi:hypothetical protein